MIRRHLVRLATMLALALSTGLASPIAIARAQPAELVIFAAASLKTALDDAAAAWSRQTGKPMPKISYAASSALARQLEQGAPADIFLSADLDWMDYVAAKGIVRGESRITFWATGSP